MGDPEPAFGFGRMLEILLSARYPDKKFEVVNLAVTAINSHVILPIAQDSIDKGADFWIVYAGNNEVVGPFGAGSAFGRGSTHLGLIRASIALKQWRVGQFLQQFRYAVEDNPDASWGGMEMFLPYQLRKAAPEMAAVYSHFKTNLRDIIRAGERAGAAILLCTVAANARDCAPFASLHRTDLSAAEREEWEEIYQAGVQFQSRQQWNLALEQYKSALQIDPEFADAHFRIATVYGALEDWNSARRHFLMAKEHDALRFRADLQINDAIRTVAAENSSFVHLLDVAKKLDAQSRHGIAGDEFFLEHVHLNFSGNYQVARLLAERIAKMLPGGTPASAAEWLTEQGCAARIAWTPWDARQVSEEIWRRLQQAPFTQQLDHSADLARQEADLEQLGGQLNAGLEKALGQYEAALKARPEDWVMRDRYARLLSEMGDVRGAVQEWERVIQEMPHYVEAYYSAGSALQQSGQVTRARNFFAKAIELRGDFVEAYNGLGLLAAAEGDLDRALEFYERALTLNPEFLGARINRGVVLAEQGKLREATEEYKRVLELAPEHPAAHLNLGRALAAMGEQAQALAHYEKAAAVDSENPIAHYNLANALSKAGRAAEAIHAYRTALKLDPSFAESHYNLGVELVKAARWDEALDAFTEAVHLQPENVPARMNLGICLAKQAEFSRAAEQFEAVLGYEPENTSALRYLKTAREMEKGPVDSSGERPSSETPRPE